MQRCKEIVRIPAKAPGQASVQAKSLQASKRPLSVNIPSLHDISPELFRQFDNKESYSTVRSDKERPRTEEMDIMKSTNESPLARLLDTAVTNTMAAGLPWNHPDGDAPDQIENSSLMPSPITEDTVAKTMSPDMVDAIKFVFLGDGNDESQSSVFPSVAPLPNRNQDFSSGAHF